MIYIKSKLATQTQSNNQLMTNNQIFMKKYQMMKNYKHEQNKDNKKKNKCFKKNNKLQKHTIKKLLKDHSTECLREKGEGIHCKKYLILWFIMFNLLQKAMVIWDDELIIIGNNHGEVRIIDK